jgi:hypothetical protein
LGLFYLDVKNNTIKSIFYKEMEMTKIKINTLVLIVMFLSLVGCSVESSNVPKVKCYPPSENQITEIGSAVSVERREGVFRYSIIKTDAGVNVVVKDYPVVMNGDKLKIEKVWETSGHRDCGWKMFPCVRIGNSSECNYIVDSDIQFREGIYR